MRGNKEYHRHNHALCQGLIVGIVDKCKSRIGRNPLIEKDKIDFAYVPPPADRLGPSSQPGSEHLLPRRGVARRLKLSVPWRPSQNLNLFI